MCSDNTSTRSERCTPGDGTCEGDNFCKVAEGTCGTEGRCEVMPAQCDRTLKQVCGCNGATYDNECLAFSHGVSVDYAGACGSQPESNDCTLDGPSSRCASNEFCAADEGQCLLRMKGIPGKCQLLRDTCNYSYNPVCGCDMETYDNADCAQAAGVNVAREGACDSNDRNVDRTSCTYYNVNDDNCSANNAFCRIEDGDCRSKVGSQSGLCGIKPKRCSRDNRPVCGCDSKTYGNECMARFAGVNIMHNGACSQPESNDCTLDGPSSQCGSNEFCAADEGQCMLMMAGIPGKCQPLRDTCNYSYNPVCGCDMETYDNADCAQAAGVNVVHEGACNSNDRTSCTYYDVKDDTCQGNGFCRIGKGDCRDNVASQSGYCGIKPEKCSLAYQPVCGCDSKTYDNDCVARFEGVNVMYNGKC